MDAPPGLCQKRQAWRLALPRRSLAFSSLAHPPFAITTRTPTINMVMARAKGCFWTLVGPRENSLSSPCSGAIATQASHAQRMGCMSCDHSKEMFKEAGGC